MLSPLTCEASQFLAAVVGVEAPVWQSAKAARDAAHFFCFHRTTKD
jgi:hypothetical protein